VQERLAGRRPDTVILLEHQPVITLGRNADGNGITAAPEQLEQVGIAVHRVERGGQVTYHGPGQTVGYPIICLKDLGLGARKYVHLLEQVMIELAGRFGVAAWRHEGRPGIFCRSGKLGAIGVAVRHGVSFHGFAFNVEPDLGHFRFIVPCGLADVTPTSLRAVLASPPAMATVYRELDGILRKALVPVANPRHSPSS
jgi:lipoate-protein ligase B